MERKEAYALIQQYNLQDEVKNRWGDNYTRVTTDKLVALIEEHENGQKKPEVKKDSNEISNAYEAACLAFLGILDDAGVLDSLLEKLDD